MNSATPKISAGMPRSGPAAIRARMTSMAPSGFSSSRQFSLMRLMLRSK